MGFKKSSVLIIFLSLTLLGLGSMGSIGVKAAVIGKVCITDISSTFCPPDANPTVISGTVGTPLDVAVNIQGSDTLNGFDIFVKADSATVQPVSVDLTGTVLGTSTEVFAQCIEFIGSGCGTILNGPGIIREAVVALGTLVTAPASGRLFSIRFNVLHNSTGISVGYQTGCSGGSVPQGLCILVVNAGVPVPETGQESATPGAGDFFLAGDTQITIPRGTDGSGLVDVVSQAGFFGGITLSATISPVKNNGPVVNLSTTVVFILPGTSSIVRLFASTLLHTPPGDYKVTITGTSGAKSHTLIVTITVPHR